MEAMAKGFSVFLYDSLLYGQNHKKILRDIQAEKKDGAICQFVIGDTRNTELLKKSLEDFKPDFLFHFAELVGIHICDDNPDYTKDINFESSKKVIDLGEKLKIPTIYNSTSSLYGNQKKNIVSDENALLPETTDNYCKYKLQMEKYIEHKRKENPEFKMIVLRLATIYGPSPRMRLELLPNHFTYSAISKGLIRISEPESYRSAIDIDDLISSYFAIMEKNEWLKPLYNVGHHNLKKIEVAKIIQSIIDCKIDFVGNLGDSRNLQIDSSTFSKDFNWKPKCSFEDTIKKIEKYIRKNLKEIKETDFVGIINSPLDRWLKMI